MSKNYGSAADNMIDPKFAPLWTQLRGQDHLWHRTSLPSFERILHDQEIRPNTGQFLETYPQSKASYAWHLSAVSLFDFDSSDEPFIFEHEWKWGRVLTKQLPAGVLICIPRTALSPEKLLLPADIAGDDPRLDALPDNIRDGRMVIPAVEALHIGPISAEAFLGFILTSRDDRGEYLWHKVGPDDDTLRALSDADAKWNADHQGRKAERHGRNEYTLAELVEASYAAPK